MNFLSHKLRFTGEIFERTVCGGYVNECLRFTVHNWGTEAGAEANVKVAFESFCLFHKPHSQLSHSAPLSNETNEQAES